METTFLEIWGAHALSGEEEEEMEQEQKLEQGVRTRT
jgi:hypothetical protein